MLRPNRRTPRQLVIDPELLEAAKLQILTRAKHATPEARERAAERPYAVVRVQPHGVDILSALLTLEEAAELADTRHAVVMTLRDALLYHESKRRALESAGSQSSAA